MHDLKLEGEGLGAVVAEQTAGDVEGGEALQRRV